MQPTASTRGYGRHPAFAPALAFVLAAASAPAFARIYIDPPLVQPDANGVIRFALNADNVPAPGFGAYGVDIEFVGAAVDLVNGPVDSASAPADRVSCSSALLAGAPREQIAGSVVLESGQGTMPLLSRGDAEIAFAINGASGNVATYAAGVRGLPVAVNPQAGNGVLIEFRCFAGPGVGGGTSIDVRPTLLAGESGAVFGYGTGAPALNVVENGRIQVGVATAQPVAVDDSATTLEDFGTITLVMLNDTQGAPPPTVITAFTQPANGSVNCDVALERCTYTPNPDFNGTDSYTYTIEDGDGDSDSATVTITVDPVNDDPVAVDDTASTTQDTSVTIDVLGNDTDVDGDSLSIASVTQGANGTVGNDGGDLTYTPRAGFSGTDAFTYEADDGNGGTDTATVTVTVIAAGNNPPVANPDSATTAEDTPVQIDVLANDSDADGDTLVVGSITQGARGSVANNGGNVTYTPNAGLSGPDTFTYTAFDGTDNSAPTTVTVTVIAAANNPPTANGDAGTTAEDTPLTIDVLANDTDADGDPLSVGGVTQPANGTVANNGGSLTYTPARDYFGPDSFTYTAFDGALDSPPATVSVTVTPVNDAPAVRNDVASTPEDTAVTISVLANDSDVENDSFAIDSVTQAANGRVAVVNNGLAVTYTPNPDFNGLDQFTYTVLDAGGATATAAVFVDVTRVDDAPLADAGPDRNARTDRLVVLDGSRSSDADRDPLTFSWRFDGPRPPGSLLLDRDISGASSPIAAFVPDVDGAYAFTLDVSDGALSDRDRVVITATTAPGNAAPNADAGSPAVRYVRTLDPVALDGSASRDPDGAPQALGFEWLFSQLPLGSALDDAQISGRFSPSAAFTPDVDGAYLVTLGVNDGDLTDTDLVSIVAASQVPPRALAGPDQSVAPGATVALDGSASNDPDAQPQPLSFAWSLVGVPAGSALGTADIAGVTGAQASFTPDVAGAYLVRLDVSDGAAGASDQLVVNVAGVPQAPVNLEGEATLLSVGLYWEGADTATFFRVWRRLDDELTPREIAQTTTRDYFDQLPSGTLSAEYFVEAENAAGAGPASATVNVVVGAPRVRDRLGP